MKVRDREIRRRRARRRKTWRLKARIAATTDSRAKARLAEKIRRINPYVQNSK